eukprot:sb/3462475/
MPLPTVIQNVNVVKTLGVDMPGPAADIFDQTDDEGSISDEEIPGHNGGGEQMTKEQILSDSEDPIFITKPQTQLYCGSCGRVMRRPVISQCGHTCCGGCVMFGGKTCPVCGSKLSTFVENIAMRDQIGALMVYCKFGCAMSSSGKVYTGQGCTDKLRFSERKVHEAQCPWSIVPCPNSKECGSLLARDLTEHLISCVHAKCENSLYGCDFVGTAAAVDDHEEECKFFVVRGIIGTFQHTMESMDNKVRDQGRQILELREELRTLRQEMLTRDHAPREVDTLHSKVLSEHQLAINLIRKEMGSIQTEKNLYPSPRHYNYSRISVLYTGQYGCDFVGTAAAVDDHEEECKFLVVRGIIGTFQHTMESMDNKVRDQGRQILELREELRALRQEMLTRDHAPREVDTLHSKVLSEHQLAINLIRKEMGSIQTELGMVDGMENQVYKCKGTFVGHTGPVFAMASLGNKLFTGSGDTTIKVWETMYNPSCIETLIFHEDQVLSLCVSETSLFSASADKSLVQWDLTTYTVLRSTSLNKAISKMTTSDNYLFTGSHKFITVWHKDSLAKYSVMEELSHWVRALAVKEDRLYAGVHASVMIWNAVSLEKLNSVEVGGVIYSIVVTDQWMVCGTKETLEMRSLRDPVGDCTLLSGGSTRADFSTVYCLDYTESGGYTRLFSGNSDCIKVWNLDRKIQCQTLDRHQGTIACVSVLKGKLYSGGYDHTVKVWRGSKIG